MEPVLKKNFDMLPYGPYQDYKYNIDDVSKYVIIQEKIFYKVILFYKKIIIDI
jgi:hypothetical protein